MRATNGPATRRRRNRVLKRAKGFWGGRSRLFRTAKEATMKADAYAFVGRRQKKRQFRRLWITRLSAALMPHDLLYSRFIAGASRAGITLNRKELSELAIHDPAAFAQVVARARAALG
jgi:large subunit ribosomal protein L20